MCTAGTTGGKDFRRNERGSAVLMLVGVVMCLLAGAVYMISHNNVTANELAGARSKVKGDALAMRVHTKLKQAFLSYPSAGSTCLPPELGPAAVQAFRNYSGAAAPPIVLKLKAPLPPGYTCLYDDDDRKQITSLQIKVTEMSLEANALARNLSVSVDVGTVRAKSTIDQTFHVARDYRLRVVSLSQFGVVFPANPDDGGPFVRVNGPAKVRLQTTVLFGDTNSPGWDQLQPAVPDQVVYGRYAYSRFSELEGTGTPSVADFRVSHPYGIQAGIVADSFVKDFLPDSSTNWNHRFDYSPLYNGTSYAVPEIPGQVTTSNCLSGIGAGDLPADQTFSPARADVVEVPDAVNGYGPRTLKQTCVPGGRPTFLLYLRSGQDFTIDLDPNDSNFCGIVVAKRLVVNIAQRDAVKYGLLGHFFVQSIQVNSQPSATAPPEVRIYNPEESEPLEGLSPLPTGQSLSSLSEEFKTLASASAWNLYVPLSKAGPFRPRAPSDYLMSCPESPPYWAYQSTYNPIHLLSGFSGYQNDSVGAVYSMESL